MKYTCSIDINLPRTKVIELFDKSENLPKWQPELLSFEHQGGKPGQVGARSRLVYQMGKRKISMIETITKRNLPDEFSGTYATKGVLNLMNNKFIELPKGKTKWISENEFKFSGFMWLMAFFLGSQAFRKQTDQYLQNFKDMCESPQAFSTN